jgi:4-hydroxybenzoate polyprenyltransferase
VSNALFEAMRPRQWTKNVFVFAGIIFAKKLSDVPSLLLSVAAFCLFCVLSSGVYLINDLLDAEQDRQHPTKKQRPIASGRLSPPVAIVAAVALTVAGIGLAFVVNAAFAMVAITYFVLNVLYTYSLKHLVILDVLSIAMFFVLRAAAGAEAIDVPISHWLLICTVLLALFIALSKRRHELVLLNESASSHRASLTEYTPYLLDQMIAVVTASTLMAYILYTVDARTVAEVGSTHLLYTVPCVIYGILRYLYLIHQRGEGGDPDRIVVSDPPFIINMLVWAAVAASVVYWH